MRNFRYIVLLLCMILLVGCSEEAVDPVVTYEPSTTAATEATEISEEPAESTTEKIETYAPIEPLMPYEQTYGAANVQRDAVGNMWLYVTATVKNTSDESICLSGSAISVFSGSVEVTNIEDAVCYPNVIEPGECGYYYERVRTDADENAELHIEVHPNVERAVGIMKQKIEDFQVHVLGNGIEIYGNMEPVSDSRLVCVAAIFMKEDGTPAAIVTDYIDASQTQFVLSSDKLPEGISVTSATTEIFVYPYES